MGQMNLKMLGCSCMHQVSGSSSSACELQTFMHITCEYSIKLSIDCSSQRVLSERPSWQQHSWLYVCLFLSRLVDRLISLRSACYHCVLIRLTTSKHSIFHLLVYHTHRRKDIWDFSEASLFGMSPRREARVEPFLSILPVRAEERHLRNFSERIDYWRNEARAEDQTYPREKELPPVPVSVRTSVAPESISESTNMGPPSYYSLRHE